MRVLIDTNILIDVLAKRGDFYRDSLQVLRLCETGGTEGYVSAVTITDLMYVLRKYLGRETLRETVKTLLAVLQVADVTKSDVANAFEHDMNDYEDALQASCAKRIGAEYIVTRNVRDFTNSPVKAILPGEFVTLVQGRD